MGSVWCYGGVSGSGKTSCLGYCQALEKAKLLEVWFGLWIGWIPHFLNLGPESSLVS